MTKDEKISVRPGEYKLVNGAVIMLDQNLIGKHHTYRLHYRHDDYKPVAISSVGSTYPRHGWQDSLKLAERITKD